MPLVYEDDILLALKLEGYTTTRLREEKLLSEGVIQSLREFKPISWNNIGKVCDLLRCSPDKVIKWVPGGTVYKVYRNNKCRHAFIIQEGIQGTVLFSFIDEHSKIYSRPSKSLERIFSLKRLSNKDELVFTTHDLYAAKHKMVKLAECFE